VARAVVGYDLQELGRPRALEEAYLAWTEGGS